MGNKQFGIDHDVLNQYAAEIKEIAQDVQVAIVIGGGNIFRGIEAADGGMEARPGPARRDRLQGRTGDPAR